jgi:hypothetical protein
MGAKHRSLVYYYPTIASVSDQIDQIDQLITLKLQVLSLMVSNTLDPNSWS